MISIEANDLKDDEGEKLKINIPHANIFGQKSCQNRIKPNGVKDKQSEYDYEQDTRPT